jgi:hypothetical protein
MSVSAWIPTYNPSASSNPVHVPEHYAPDTWCWELRDDTPYRKCSYCGSIHPEDLVSVNWQSSDWALGKYAHKLYVRIPPMGESGYGVQVKFYSQHLADPNLLPSAKLTFESSVGITFEFEDGAMRIDRGGD